MAIVKKYQTKVIAINKFSEDVFTLDLLSLGKPFQYEPGQFLHLALDEYDPCFAWPESRCFSMQSNPTDKLIRITYAIKGFFTKKMAESIHLNTNLWIKLPFGDLFTQEHNKENAIFIAGGTGITPFLSLFTYPSFSSYNNACLYAGFRKKELNQYQDEISLAKQINPSFTVNYLYQDVDGVIDIARILEKSNAGSSFFISGPPIMIKQFKKYLLDNGIPNSDIKTDEWE